MLIKVKVIPQAKENSVIKKSEDTFVVKVRAKAKRGEANRMVKELLQEYFQVSSAKIRLLKGGKKPNKIFEIETKPSGELY